MKNKKLWICGQLKGEWSSQGGIWDFQGVFSDKKKAVSACKNSQYFIFSSELDCELPSQSIIPKDGHYPVKQKKEKSHG